MTKKESSELRWPVQAFIPIFNCEDPVPDPYSEYESGSTKLLKNEYGSKLDPDPHHWV